MRNGSGASVGSAFGNLLREYRIRAGLSQSDLAEKAQISTAAVGALERGDRQAPYQSTVALLAKALHLNAEESAALESMRRNARSKSPKSAPQHNLRVERTSFVGRKPDIADIIKLIDRSRLVTIVGSGGIGKTRTAIEVATQLLGHSWDETWFIDLAPLTDGELIASKIAYTIQPALSESGGSIGTLAQAIAKRRMFLILDNCEHVIAHAAQAADTILGLCPHVTILATSRERLNVGGEFVYRLPSLLMPPDIPDRMNHAQDYPAVDLFIQRAQALAPQLTFDSTTLPTVVEIVRRLDGIPLAIELTAAQVAILGVETLRNRLYQEFDVPSGRRDLPARQQTVNATISWSFALLTAEEQQLLCDISVFAGGFTLNEAEAISADEALVLPRLSELVNKSLVNVERADCSARYTLLESVRTFGLQRLRETDGYTAVARRHAQLFARVADEYRYAEMSPELARELLPDIDNVRSAIAWSLNASAQDDRIYAGRIISAFDALWTYIGRPREYRQLLNEAIERIEESRDPLTVCRLLCSFINQAGREPVALGAVDRAVRLSEQCGDLRVKAELYIILTFTLQVHGMLMEADRWAQRAADLMKSEQLQVTSLHLSFLANRHELRMTQGRFEDARTDLAAAEALALAHGANYFVACHCYSRYSTLEYALGNKRLALEFAERMMASEFRTTSHVALGGLERLAMLRLDCGDVDGAVQPLREWLLLRPMEEFPTRGPLEIAALFLALRGRSHDAAKLIGSVHEVERRTHFRRNRMRENAHNRLCSLLQEQLSPEALAAAEAEGARLKPEQAQTEALAALK